MDKCNTWATVDFGRGPVQVRCTEVEEHERCKCEVLLGLKNSEANIEHRNVFDQGQRKD